MTPSDPILVVNSAIAPSFVAVYSKEKGFESVVEQGDSPFSVECITLIDQLLTKASRKLCDFKDYAFVAGPGSFTGIRTGLAALKGMLFGRGAMVYPISSLEIIAATSFNSGWERIIPVIDAKLNAVYVALFNGNGERLCIDSAVEPSLLESFVAGKSVLVGTDSEKFAKYTPNIETRKINNSNEIIKATELTITKNWDKFAELLVSVDELLPSYLRASYADIVKPK